jgi:hypothetical protein
VLNERGTAKMAVSYPAVGQWYSIPGGTLFEVVALDSMDGTIEIQYFDGTVEELDLDDWEDMWIQNANAPEDWSGSVDIEREDFLPNDDGSIPTDWSNPLDYIDQVE